MTVVGYQCCKMISAAVPPNIVACGCSLSSVIGCRKSIVVCILNWRLSHLLLLLLNIRIHSIQVEQARTLHRGYLFLCLLLQYVLCCLWFDK